MSANLKSIWSKITNMKLFLAGGESRHWIYENIGEIMQIFLAGENGKKKIINDLMGRGGHAHLSCRTSTLERGGVVR